MRVQLRVLKRSKTLTAALAVAVIGSTAVCLKQTFWKTHTSSAITSEPLPLFSSTDPQSVYAADPKDAWNRIFQLLFTRSVKARLSSEFPEGAPFTRAEGMGIPALRISTRVFEQTEIGDRAIEPLYPSFFTSSGALQVLTEPHFSQLKQALTDALSESSSRPPIARALMQSDVWAAYDILFTKQSFGTSKDQQIAERRDQLLLLLARFIRKLALSPQDVEALPDNYSAGIGAKHLPDLFSAESGWMEIQLLPNRLHDYAANFRRAARVFIKPRGIPQDKSNFLEGLKGKQDIAKKVGAVALAVENLLIDSRGSIVPSAIINEVQVRSFLQDQQDGPARTEIRQYELSRRLLLTNPASGGFIENDEKASVYLAAAGNDYGFATPSTPDGSPIMIRLRTRCEQCHGGSGTNLMTFSVHDFPPLPPVTVLKPEKNDHAFYVARIKQAREDFRTLQQGR